MSGELGEGVGMQERVQVFRGAIAEVSQRVQRPVEAHEMAAIGLVIQAQHIEGLQDMSDNARFAREIFGIIETDAPKEVAWKVHVGTDQAVRAEIDRRRNLGENVNLEEQTANTMHVLAVSTDAKGGVCSLGTAPVEWLSPDLQQPVRVEMLK